MTAPQTERTCARCGASVLLPVAVLSCRAWRDHHPPAQHETLYTSRSARGRHISVSSEHAQSEMETGEVETENRTERPGGGEIGRDRAERRQTDV